MNILHPRVLAKFVLSRFHAIPNYCKKCGRDSEPFYVPDELWHGVIGPNANNERCLRCFHHESLEKGHHLEWGLR